MKQRFSLCLTFLLCRFSLTLMAQPMKIGLPTFQLNVDAIRQKVFRAPLEKEGLPEKPPVLVDLPLADGKQATFKVEATPVLGASLSARFPEIKTYRLLGQSPAADEGRLTISPYGLQAIISTPRGYLFIEPAQAETGYRIYYGKDGPASNMMVDELLFKPGYSRQPVGKNKVSMGEAIYTFQLALLADGEYAEARTNGTPVLGAVIAAMAADVNSVNAIFERELSIRFVLEEAYAYLNKASDPFPMANLGPGREAMVGIGQLIEAGIFSSDQFDLGHLLSGRNIGGSAFVGVVGDDELADVNGDQQLDGPFKAGGGIGTDNPVGSHWVGLICHEIGHMFNALHTFNGVDGTCGRPGQYDEAFAYEPGSGSTLMSYAGKCEDDDISQTLDPYFHIASLEVIYQFLQEERIKNCMHHESSGNTPPRVFANPLGRSYLIPKGTPFYLSGEAVDLEDENLTYTWEQYDLGNQGLLEESPFDISDREGENGAPLFRSFPPTASSRRTFPRWPALLGDASAKGEMLPQQARSLTFRLTARDNHSGSGGLGSDEVQVQVDGNSGPFEITSFNTLTTWSPFSEESVTLTWDVANTNQAPIACDKVNILFSVNGGESFPIVIAEGIPNTGSYTFPIPSVFTTEGRILIEAANNIFFDVNDAAIKIGGECYAEGTTIGPTVPVTSDWGTEPLRLEMAPDFGNPLQHLDFQFTPFTPKANLTTSNSGTCFSFNYPTAYFTQHFQVNKTGEYTFHLPDVNHTTYYLTNLYEAPYEPSDPCFNWMASSSHFVSGSVSVTDEMKVRLEPRKEYVLVTFALTFGDYAVEIAGPQGGNAYVGMVPPDDAFAYTYLVVDQKTETLVGFNAEADLREFNVGQYQVYGFSYPVGFSLDGFIGLDLQAIQEKMLMIGFCGDLSDNFREVTITGNQTILPVELLYFVGLPQAPTGIRLDWRTATEENNEKFVLERSSDGRIFHFLGEVKGAGHAFTESAYTFEDTAPFVGLNYYRLSQIDFDGSIHQSGIISVLYEGQASVQLFPNPVSSDLLYLNYHAAAEEEIRLEWTDSSGRALRDQSQTIHEGNNRIALSMAEWPIGLYQLKIYQDRAVQTFKVVKL
ncbi:MAG: M12 family metallo-peptidase [Saprospiraceae bacterium]